MPQSWIRPPRPKIVKIVILPSMKHDQIFLLEGPHVRLRPQIRPQSLSEAV